MKKVILVANSLYKYRAHIYSEFIELFDKEGYDFKVVISTKWEEKTYDMPKDRIQFLEGNLNGLRKYLNSEKPDIIINFLHPTNKSIWFLYLYTWINKIPNIYWNHGVNLQDPNNKIKLIAYNLLHKISSAILLYTENEFKYIKKKYHSKTFYANNTINFKKIPEVTDNLSVIKKKYNLNYEKHVLFVGRIQKRKRLDVIIEIFKSKEFQNYGLIIVGPGLIQEEIEGGINSPNIKYLGAIYDDMEINKIFKASDLFCIPGTNGLGINQAMYWGLPCLALDVLHSPEIIYLEDEVNGFISRTKEDLKDKLLLLLENKELYNKFSKNSYEIIRKKADILIMFKGFINAIKHVKK